VALCRGDLALEFRDGTAGLAQPRELIPSVRLGTLEQPHLTAVVVTAFRVNPGEPSDDDPSEDSESQKDERNRSAQLRTVIDPRHGSSPVSEERLSDQRLSVTALAPTRQAPLLSIAEPLATELC
jgi:hypothetical protein